MNITHYQDNNEYTNNGCYGNKRYGIVLSKREMEPEAIDVLLQSVKKYEYNWSAWMQLGSLASTTKQVRETYDIYIYI